MSWVRMNIQNGQVSGELEMDQLGSGDRLAMISGFFGVFGLEEKEEKTEPVASVATAAPTASVPALSPIPSVEIPAKVLSSSIKSKQAIQETVKGIEIDKAGRVDKPALINSERTLVVPLGEKLAEAYKNMDADSVRLISSATETNEHLEEWKVTGIKYKNGVAHYRCRYWCKNHVCRNKGNHYILPETETVKCHNCESELEVREAILGGTLQKDDWGNFFIADHLV